MKLVLTNDEPIFMQIARAIEDEILQDGILEEEQVPSTNELAKIYQINPATVLKGINVLVDRNILYKKRGIGMFVQKGAKVQIRQERVEVFKENYIENLVKEAKKIGISKKELMQMLENVEGV
jgi:DNA-binding transcriptional regulator YhcF (GntR family)